MGQMTFDEPYSGWYNTIKGNGSNVREISSYNPVAGEVRSLDFVGKSKESFCNDVQGFDSSCNSLYTSVSKTVEKTKIVYGSFYDLLSLLKSKIELYNNTYSEYVSLCAKLKNAKKEESKRKEG